MMKQKQNRKSDNRKPDYAARIKNGPEKDSGFMTVGGAWDRDEGGLYIKLYGKQVIESPIYLFPQDQTA